MKNTTRLLYTQLTQTIAASYGVASATQMFAVEPTHEQRIENAMQESVEFLTQINLVPVDELKGAKVSIGVSSTVAGRTSEANLPRKPRYIGALDEQGYELAFTEFDTMIKYGTLDAWAKFPDFGARYSRAVLQRIGLDRIMIGFHGVSAAAQTDRGTKPMLQDVNKGWLQHLREARPDQFLGSDGTPIAIGAANAYKNLDALAYDLVSGLEPWARSDTDLVTVVSQDLVDDKYFPMINRPLSGTVDGGKATSDEVVGSIIKSAKQLGGKPAVVVPFFPEGSMMITKLSNLSIYYQDGKRRRMLKEEPEFNRVSDYQSSNEGYVIEDYDYAVAAENITITA